MHSNAYKIDFKVFNPKINSLIIYGGKNDSIPNNCYLNDIHILNLETLAWCQIQAYGDKLIDRSSHTMINVGKY